MSDVLRQTVQSVVVTALEAAEVSAAESASSLNTLIDVESNILPQLSQQLHQSNDTIANIIQTLSDAASKEDNIIISTTALDTLTSSSENDNNNHEACEKRDEQNRNNLRQHYSQRLERLEKENAQLHTEIRVLRSIPNVSPEKHAEAMASLDVAQLNLEALLRLQNDMISKEEEHKNKNKFEEDNNNKDNENVNDDGVASRETSIGSPSDSTNINNISNINNNNNNVNVDSSSTTENQNQNQQQRRGGEEHFTLENQTRLLLDSNNENNKNKNIHHHQMFVQPGWTKETWFAAFQNLEQISKNMISSQEAKKLKDNCEVWEKRATESLDRVARLETDVNSLRFSNGVLIEQLASLVCYHENEKPSSSNNTNNTNNIRVKGAGTIAAASQLQFMRPEDFLTQDAAHAAHRAIENAADVSAASSHATTAIRSITATSVGTKQNNLLPLNADPFCFDGVKQLVERCEQLSRGLYEQEVAGILEDTNTKTLNAATRSVNVSSSSSSAESDKLLLLKKRRRVEEELVGDVSSSSKFSDSSSSGSNRNQNPTLDRGIQTDSSSSSSFSKKSSSSPYLKNSSNNKNAVDSCFDDDNNSNQSDDDDDDSNSNNNNNNSFVVLDGSPEVFNSIQSIVENLQSGFSAASKCESEFVHNNTQILDSEIDSLRQQLSVSQSQVRNLTNERDGLVQREITAKNLCSKLETQIREQTALEVQIPMMKEIPAILSRFEVAVSNIASGIQEAQQNEKMSKTGTSNLQRHVGGLESVVGRLQSQYQSFNQLLSSQIQQQQQQQGNNDDFSSSAFAVDGSNNNNNNNLLVLGNTTNNQNQNSNNNRSDDPLIEKLQSRIQQLESDLESQSNELSIERNRIVEQLERMFRAEEETKRVTSELDSMRQTSFSQSQVDELRSEIIRLQQEQEQNSQAMQAQELQLHQELELVSTSNTQNEVRAQEAEVRAKHFEKSATDAGQARNDAFSQLSGAHEEITRLSRTSQEISMTLQTMTQQLQSAREDNFNLRTSMLSTSAAREQFAALFPGDSAGIAAIDRVGELCSEITDKTATIRSLSDKNNTVVAEIDRLKQQLQEVSSERVTSAMKATSAESELQRMKQQSSREIASLQADLNFQRQDVTRITQERDSALERANLLSQHVDVLSQDQLSANARRYGLTQTKEFEAQMKEMHSRNVTLTENLDQVSNNKNQLEQELNVAQNGIRQRDDTISELQINLRRGKENESNLMETIQQSEIDVATVRLEKDDVETELETCQEERTKLDENLKQTTNQLETTKTKCEKVEKDKQELEKEVGKLKQEVREKEQLVVAAREAIASGGGGGGGGLRSTSSSAFAPSSSTTTSTRTFTAAPSSGGNVLAGREVGRFSSAVTNTQQQQQQNQNQGSSAFR